MDNLQIQVDSANMEPQKLDAISSESDLLPAKRARLKRAGAQTRRLRRTARLQARQHPPGSQDHRIPLSVPPHEPQTGVGSIPSTSKPTGLPRTNIQPSGVEHEETVQQLKLPKRRNTLPLELKFQEQEQLPPATRLRTRQTDSDGDDNEHQLKRVRLTQNNLALFNKVGRKKGSNKASTCNDSAGESTTTKTISTTSSGFDVQAYQNGIIDPVYSKPPTNIKDIEKQHARSRETASPTESEHRCYARTVSKAGNEATMVVEVSGQLLKKYDDDSYTRSFNRAFTAFPKDVGFNNGLSAPQPDFVEGPEMQAYRPFPIHEHINGAVLYKDDRHSVTLPHLAGEWKGPDVNIAEATLQSGYDGAALVYARNQALSLIGKPDPPGHAEVRTFTMDGTNINFYAHYAAPSEEDGTIEYHQYQYASTNVKDSHKGHKDGRRGIRNEQDHARDQSYALRDRLKEHWKQRRGGLHLIAEGVPIPVADGTFNETSAYEDEAGYEIVEQPCQPTPAASSKSCKAASSSVPSGQKRKASLPSHEPSRQRSKGESYWVWDAESGQYFHKHSDGRVTWLDDSDDGN